MFCVLLNGSVFGFNGKVLIRCLINALAVYTCVIIFFGIPSHGQLLLDEDYTFEEELANEIPCQEPAKIANGETIVWGDGLLLEYRCKQGYFPVGITHGACDLSTGAWTIEPPVCAEKGCPELTAPAHGVVNIDNSGGLATIVCRQGYFLVGDSTLVCEDGQWRGIFPLCAMTPKTNERTKSRKDPEISAVNEDSSDHSVSESDESCFYNQIMPPEIKNAVVDTKYVLNEVRHRYVMVAFYTCMGRFKLRNSTNSQLFCKNLIWSAPAWPKCIAEDDPCETDNGGCNHYCTPTGNQAYACSCYDGYSLSGDAKTCTDADECAINNGDCQQECFNTEGSYFCACLPGFVPKGSKCLVARPEVHGNLY